MHTTPTLRTHHWRGFASGQNAACAGSIWRGPIQFPRFAGSLTRSGGRGRRLKPAYRMMGEPVNRLGGAGTGNRSRLAGEGNRGATTAGSLPLEPTYHRFGRTVNRSAERIWGSGAARGNPPVRDVRESTTPWPIRQPCLSLAGTQLETDTLCL
jgi:hypothetical protein